MGPAARQNTPTAGGGRLMSVTHLLIHLPGAHVRMTPLRKHAILEAIDAGQLSVDTAIAYYNLSHEELDGWRRCYREGGVRGLRVTMPPRPIRKAKRAYETRSHK
jgi:hypothetical protein